MKITVKKMADLSGITVRTLHYYHHEGLLIPCEISVSGYRYYNEANLEVLQQILFLRELDFSIKEIKRIMNSPDFNPREALKKQRNLLLLKRNRLDSLITVLDKKLEGETNMNFKAFDTSHIEEAKEKYQKEVEERWGGTAAYAQSEKKSKGYSNSDWEAITAKATVIYQAFSDSMEKNADDPEVQDLVFKWQHHISENYYDCSKEILADLGLMYVTDPRFTQNIDQHKKGLAQFMSDAISIYTKK